MVIIRTDGGGISYNDERLIEISRILDVIPLKTPLLRLKDHKGNLEVLWNNEPYQEEMDIVKCIWLLFNEDIIEHMVL